MIGLRRFFIIFLVLGFISQKILGMEEDNRFLPEYPRINHYRTWEEPSVAYLDGQIMVAHEAFDHDDDEKDVGIFEVFGNYFENKLADAIVAIGLPDPFDLFLFLWR